MKKGVLLFVIIGMALQLKAQVRNTDTTTNQPLNSAANILMGNSSKNITLGAYAQIDYNQPIDADVREIGKLDVHRLVLFLGYRFSDRAQFVTEIEFEHVSEVYVEQAFLNYRIKDGFDLRAGLLLIPMGIINEYHEPTTFNGVERPNLEGKIVPTTWRELGAGFAGNFPSLSLKYQAYVVNGFNGFDGTGKFRGSDGFRKGRQKGAESYMSSPNLSTKIDYYGIPGLKLGLSGYFGKSQSTLFDGLDKNNAEASATADSSVVNISMIGLDARYQYRAFSARAMLVNSTIGNTDQYNAFTGADLGSKMFGYYVEAGYDVLSLIKPGAKQRLDVFARYEQYDTHKEVTGDLVRNLAYDRTDITVGAGFMVAPGAVLKADYQIFKNEAQGGATQKQLNLGVGIWF